MRSILPLVVTGLSANTNFEGHAKSEADPGSQNVRFAGKPSELMGAPRCEKPTYRYLPKSRGGAPTDSFPS